MAVLRGEDLILFHGASDNPVSRATSCSLELQNEEQEITSKTSGDFKEYQKGRMEWSISVDGLVDFEDADGFNILEAAMFSGDDVDVAVGIATKGLDTKPDGLDDTKKYYSGKVKVMSLNLNTGNAGETASYSATLRGNGELKIVTPT